MSTRLEMLQVARLAPRLLGESIENVRDFLDSQQTDGGFVDRDGSPDLYYTVFGLDGLAASHIDEAPPSANGEGGRVSEVAGFLGGFGDGEGLDLVHLACLARSWAAIGEGGRAGEGAPIEALLDRLLALRRGDGGWAMTGEDEASTSYGTFLAIGALQDLGAPIGRPSAAVEFLDSMALDTGGYALDARTPVATTPTTAASVVALRQLGGRAHVRTADWLRGQHHAQGGFLATDGAPMPDLLSTAVALHALSVLDAPADDLREILLDFVDTLWTAKGGFYGHWADDGVDAEYTFYGLLTLGHLAVMGEG